MERKTSALEEYFVSRIRIGGVSNIMVGVDLKASVSKPQLYRALAKVIFDEPMLSVNVFFDKSYSTVVFRKVGNTLNLDDLVLFEPEATRQSLVDRYLLTDELQYNKYDALWRLVVCNQDKSVLLLYNHVALDGMSGPLFFKRLVKYLNQDKDNNEKASAVVPVSPETLIPSISDMVDCSLGLVVGVVFRAVLAWKSWSHYLGLTRSVVDGINKPSEETKTNASVFLDLDKSEADKLLATARKHGLTLYTLVYAVYVRSQFDVLLHSKASNKPFSFELVIPYNPRPALNSKYGEVLSNLFLPHFYKGSVVPTAIQSTTEGVLALAKRLQESITTMRNAKELPGLKFVGYFNEVGSYNFVADHRGKPVDNHFITSNLGAVDFNQAPEDAHVVENIWFTHTALSWTSPIILSLVGVKGGATCLNVSTQNDPDAVLANRLMEAIKRNLLFMTTYS